MGTALGDLHGIERGKRPVQLLAFRKQGADRLCIAAAVCDDARQEEKIALRVGAEGEAQETHVDRGISSRCRKS